MYGIEKILKGGIYRKWRSYSSAIYLICNRVTPFNFQYSVDGMMVKFVEHAVDYKNSFKQPHRDDIIWYTFDNILCKTKPQNPISGRITGLEIEDFINEK